MTTLWDTTGTAVVKALQAERRAAGSVSSSLALTLIVIAEEGGVAEAETAATIAASAHPCRLIIVVRRQIDAPQPRLDAEVSLGGRLGPGEAIVMRMYGRLGLHAESVVLPLLAPDAPVVTWWYGEPPDKIAYDPLGVFADRRVTDAARCSDQLGALRQRAEDYAVGDTDLAWARLTSWRGVLASAYDSVTGPPTGATVTAEPDSPSGALLAAWIGARLGIDVKRLDGRGPGVNEACIDVDGGEDAGGTTIRLTRESDRTGRLARTGHPERTMPLPRGELGDLLAEELRRLDPDVVYAEALGAAFGVDLSDRPAHRIHIWRDPAEQAAAAS